MTMTDKAMREAFEKWWEDNKGLTTLYGAPAYRIGDINPWELWQAALASRPTPIAGLVEKMEGLRCTKTDCRPIAHEVHKETLEKCIALARTHSGKEVEEYGVRWETFGMSGGGPVGSLMEAVEFYNEKIAKGMTASIYRIAEPSAPSVDMAKVIAEVQGLFNLPEHSTVCKAVVAILTRHLSGNKGA